MLSSMNSMERGRRRQKTSSPPQDMSRIKPKMIQPNLLNKACGLPRVDDRRVLNGIFWRLRTGALVAHNLSRTALEIFHDYARVKLKIVSRLRPQSRAPFEVDTPADYRGMG